MSACLQPPSAPGSGAARSFRSVPDAPDSSRYVRTVLDAYRRTPGTTGRLRPADRRLARDLYERGVAAQTVLDALLLASVRRFTHATPDLPPPTVRSFAYFRDVIEELLRTPLDAGYRSYLARRLERSLAPSSSST